MRGLRWITPGRNWWRLGILVVTIIEEIKRTRRARR